MKSNVVKDDERMEVIIDTAICTLLFVLAIQSWIMHQRWGHYVYKMLVKVYAYALLTSLLNGIFQVNHIANTGIMLGLVAGSFILVHMGMYLFYHTKEAVPVKTYIAPAAVISLLPLIFYFVNSSVGLVLVLLLILVHASYCFYYVLPKMINSRLYAVSLFSFAAAAVAFMIEGFSEGRAIISQSLLLLAYFFCFLLHFGRVLDVLQGVTMNSISDGLTGLYNAGTIRAKSVELVEKDGLKGVLFIDIDHFKNLNDTSGHAEGDKVLKQVAKIVQTECRDKGMVGRYGGEELLVLLTNVPEDSTSLAERIRSCVEKQTIVTISVGYCKYTEGMEASEVINNADKALYTAKNTGRNRVVNFMNLDEDPDLAVRISSQV
ncbi:two-component system cell cycle response regulator [Paenibacillus polymyxa]